MNKLFKTTSKQKEGEEEKRKGEELRIYIISKHFYTGYYKKTVNQFYDYNAICIYSISANIFNIK